MDYKERPRVYEALAKELDSGGVTKEKLKRVVRGLRKEHIISEIDARNILALAKEEQEEEKDEEVVEAMGENTSQSEGDKNNSGKEWI